jgi:hypothetical protein
MPLLPPSDKSPARLPISIREQGKPFNACMVVPTGLGASIGGFGGDASLAMNLLATACDQLITHPNVANAAVLQHLPANVLYTEGYALDHLFKGEWGLQPVTNQRIGVVLDAGLPDDVRTLTQNTIAAMQTVYGIHIVSTVETDEPASLQLTPMASGTITGEINNPETILNASNTLVTDYGATAIALGVLFPDLDLPEEASYRAGQGADPIGALEALLSHTIVSQLGIPCAHAPMLPMDEAAPETEKLLDPRVAAEFIAPTFLPCILSGLRQAPNIVHLAKQQQHSNSPSLITRQDIHALVVPANALGGIPMLAALEHHIPVIAVKSNQTVLHASRERLFKDSNLPALIHVSNYQEAAGVLLALKAGLPMAI